MKARTRLRVRVSSGCVWVSLVAAGTLIALRSPLVAAEPQTVVITMRDMPPTFEPSHLRIKVGEIVKWENTGGTVHHATDSHEMAIKSDDVATPSADETFDSGFLQPGESFTHRFIKPGVYKYVCVVHEAAGMIGEITVVP